MQHTERSLNRYEQCVQELERFSFELDIIYEKYYAKKVDSKAVLKFFHTYWEMQMTTLADTFFQSSQDLKDGFKIYMKNIPIHVGFPDELTNTDFLNKLYANLNLTGDERPYKIYRELMKNQDFMKHHEKNFTFLEGLSENAKDVYHQCARYECYDAVTFIS